MIMLAGEWSAYRSAAALMASAFNPVMAAVCFRVKSAKVSDFPPGQLESLAKSINTSVRHAANKILATASSRNQEELMKTYSPSLQLLGDYQKGKVIFEKNCSKCHRAGEIGFEIGPNPSAAASIVRRISASAEPGSFGLFSRAT